jgi:hypothetical protein
MALDPRIILAGQQPDMMNVLARSNQAAQEQITYGRQNALARTMQEQGPGILAGDQGALNALARFDPQAALGVQQTQQSMAFDREKMGMLRAESKAAAAARLAEQAATLDANALAAEQERITSGLRGAAAFYGKQDRAGYDAWLAQRGLDPAEYPFEQFPAIAASMAGVLDAMKEFAPARPADNATEEKIARLAELGVGRSEAIKIVDLTDMSRDPITGEVVLIDKRTGNRIGGTQQAPVTGQAEAPAPTPAAGGSDLTFGEGYPNSADAFGAKGFGLNLANTAVQAVGLPPVAPQVQETQNQFKVLKENLTGDIASGYPGGRVPLEIMRQIRELIPETASVFTGVDQAQSQLRALGRSLQEEMQRIDAQLGGQISPTRRGELEASRAALDAGIGRIRSALNSFNTGGGVRPEVADRLKAYE